MTKHNEEKSGINVQRVDLKFTVFVYSAQSEKFQMLSVGLIGCSTDIQAHCFTLRYLRRCTDPRRPGQCKVTVMEVICDG
ncbi:hypothetical protein T11_95 [Trichinella zimbabwensis]|uniref:Uncharacterized protein n=1 Tax=Trichinella zimbabwensis TaxID=268475 RepID=A0A0V1H4E1_9BILA|nr:hypothetical protein T11_95 [Trichinella zimbabwensis]